MILGAVVCKVECAHARNAAFLPLGRLVSRGLVGHLLKSSAKSVRTTSHPVVVVDEPS